MTKKEDKTGFETLRHRAEMLLNKRAPQTTLPSSKIEMRELIQELEVHQIEIEMQNHELTLQQGRAEQAIDKYTELYDFAPVGYFTLSQEGEILELNLLGAKILGNHRSNLKHKHFVRFVSPNSQPIFNHFLQEIFQSQKKANCEIALLAKGGNAVFVQASGVVTENGKECLLTVSDISAFDKIQKELEFKNAQLNRAIAEKDKFFSIIAHDLRSPFNGFLGLTQLLVDELPTLDMVQIQQMASLMRNSAKNVFNLIENLLDWSRMQRGITRFSPETINLSEKIEYLTGSVKEMATKKQTEIELKIPTDLNVFVDLNMFSSTIRNLLSNAVKFTPHGGKITLSAKAMDASTVEISVSDSGIGMDKLFLENLFKMDDFVNRSGTDGEPSTGLGLLLCKEFVEKNGGKIWAESVEKVGSTFYFTSPMRDFQIK
jgi:PAS domain S-box-containing protein